MRPPLDNWSTLPHGFTFGQIYPASFGVLAGKPHLGLDLLVPIGTEIYAPADGEIIVSKAFSEGGNTTWFKFSNIVMRAMHLSQLRPIGSYKAGDCIGISGNTGTATNYVHCHIDLSNNTVNINNFSNFINPLTFFL